MIDPRAYSDIPLVPPEPLPHVSRRALRRVRDSLPIPTDCPNCGADVELVNNTAVYGREYGEWPYLYKCTNCTAYVGVHKDTDIPLGTLACAELRDARKTSKALFHKVVDQQHPHRTAAYKWLAQHMQIPAEECHFGWFDLTQCHRAGSICLVALDSGELP